MEKEQNAILEAIDIIVKKRLKNLGFNYYVDGVIQKDNNDGTYNVLINGTLYNNISSKHKLIYSVGDTVQILIKNGNWNKKYIDDKSYHNNHIVSQQYKSIDGTGEEFPLICHNGDNIWVGAWKRATRHHAGKGTYGKLFLSAGYNADLKKGNDTVYVSVPNNDNTEATNYRVVHAGNLDEINSHLKTYVLGSVYPIGSICIRETKSDPIDTLGGGVWTLVDKEFTTLSINIDEVNTYFTPNTEVVSACQFRLIRAGHTLTMKMYLTLAEGATISDSQKTLGNFNFEALGISRFPTDRSFPTGYTDGGNSIIMGYINSGTGALDVVDIVGADSVSGTSLYFDFTETIASKFMLDSACNKFYWKRKS